MVIFFILLVAFISKISIAEEKNSAGVKGYIFTAEDINSMNASNVAKVIETIPGVTALGDDNVSINGSTEVLVLLDGRNIKDPISGRIKWDQVSLNNVGRIEVIKGGGSGYGENASGGVILITSKLTDTFSGNIEVAAGNMNYKEYSGDLQTQINGIKIGVMGGYEYDDGWRANEHKEVTRGGLNLSFSPKDDISFSPSLNYLKDIKGLGGPYFAPTLYNEATFESFSANLLSSIKRLNSKSIYTHSMDQSIDAPPAPIPHIIKITPEIFSQEFTTDFTIFGKAALNTGIGYEHAKVGVQTNINNVQLPDAEHTEKKGWMFTTYKVSSEDNIYSLYLGLRGTYYNNFDNSLNPEISLGYKKDNFGAILGFNLTDRLPSYKDRYRSDAFVIANPGLEKEEFTNYKLTLLYSPFEVLSFNVTPYYTEVENLIAMDSIMTENGLRRTFVNVGSATEKGVDSSVSFRPDPRYNFSVSYTYKSAKDDDTGLWLPMRAKHRLQGKIIASPIERLSISTTVNYSSEEFSNSENTMGVASNYVVDVRVEYDIKKYKLFFQIDNMFNKDYIMPFLIPAKTKFYFTGIKYSF
ncbi:MAG: TonB-dependent receptor plug domain-containing protein [Desulfatiglans sp.]|nr:TonB-dependent receptor plug domain-containing protein [Desulfatiglans sp.]